MSDPSTWTLLTTRGLLRVSECAACAALVPVADREVHSFTHAHSGGTAVVPPPEAPAEAPTEGAQWPYDGQAADPGTDTAAMRKVDESGRAREQRWASVGQCPMQVPGDVQRPEREPFWWSNRVIAVLIAVMLGALIAMFVWATWEPAPRFTPTTAPPTAAPICDLRGRCAP